MTKISKLGTAILTFKVRMNRRWQIIGNRTCKSVWNFDITTLFWLYYFHINNLFNSFFIFYFKNCQRRSSWYIAHKKIPINKHFNLLAYGLSTYFVENFYVKIVFRITKFFYKITLSYQKKKKQKQNKTFFNLFLNIAIKHIKMIFFFRKYFLKNKLFS